ncbi:MAG: type II secretion system protein N [bacterium]
MFETIVNKGAEPAKWLLIIGIAYTLATLAWSFFDTPISNVSAVNTDNRTPASARPAANVNWILGKHLFGEAGAAPVVAARDEPVQQTRLPLELQGVFMADENQASAAIVAQRGKPGKRYVVGDTLPGNAVLDEVFTNRIVLVRAGVRETLPFPKFKSEFIAEDYPDESIEATDPDGQVDNTYGDDISNDSESDEVEPEEIVEAYRERLAEDPAAALNDLGVETVESGGYRIGNLSQNPLLQSTGLQAGDVILSVNGQPVGDISQDQLELDNIMAQGSARIEIQRGDRRFFITASLP